MDTAHMLTNMEMVPIMLLTAALMPIAAAATLGAAGFGTAMATACGGACASAPDQTSISHKKGPHVQISTAAQFVFDSAETFASPAQL
jgi:hypothetical protein